MTTKQDILNEERKVIPALRQKLFRTVIVEPSRSSYGKWVVKYSPIHFKFFWKKDQALDFAVAWNTYGGRED